MFTSKDCVRHFSESVSAGILKFGVHMNNELLYSGLRIGLIALILPFICPFFCLLRLNFFSQELCKLESSNMVYICRMSDCIMGLRLRVMALILIFLSIFLSFPILHFYIKKFCHNFLRNCFS